MDCNYCHNQFNQAENIPRLLIFCGHSLCQACCRQLHTNSRIQCPQCSSSTFIEQINFLPKNLALLKVNNIYTSTTSSQSDNLCQKHDKKYEAFCEKQKVLICVDCILQDGHRNHDMNSIKNSYTKNLQVLQRKLATIEQQLQMIEQKHKKNWDNKQITTKNYIQSKNNIQIFYDQIRAIINKEQATLVTKIQDQYQSSLSKFHQKQAQYSRKIQQINQTLIKIKSNYKLMSDVNFLQTFSTNITIINSIDTQTQEIQKSLVFMHTKNQIADNIIKNIQKNFKTQTTVQNNNNGSTTLHKKVDSVSNNGNLKNFKKNQNGNIPTYKNISKKPVKKQSVSSNGSMPQSAVYSGINHGSTNNRPIVTQNKSRNSQNVQSKSISQEKKKQQRRNDSNQKKPLSKYDFNSRCCDVSIVEPKQSMFNSFLSNMTSFLMTQKKSVFIFGGFDPENSQILKFSLNNQTWELVGKMNSLRSKFGCIFNNQTKSIMMFGGKRGKQRISDSQQWQNGQWKSSINLKKKRSGFGMVCIGQLAYCIGGNDGDSILSSLEVLNTKTGQWAFKANMHEARDQLAVCVSSDNKIYAVGGFGGKNNEPLKSAEVYDPKKDQWTYLPAMKTPRRALAAAALADGIYAIGGFDGEKYLNTVQKFQEGSRKWIKVANMQKARCTHSAVTIFDSQQILIFGGFDEGALDSVQKYSLISNEWESMPKMPGPRFMHCSVLIDQ